jgi:hypothetical protein
MFPFGDMRMRNVLGPGPFQQPQQQNQNVTPTAAGLFDQSQQDSTPTNIDILNAQDMASQPVAPAGTPKRELPNITTEFSKKLQDALDMMPQRGDYKPSKFRKIIGGIASLSAKDPVEQQQVIDEIQNKPYYLDMQDWMTHVNALMKGASEEDRQNTFKRLAYMGIIGAEQKDRGLDIKEGEAKTRADRAKAYADHIAWQDSHENWKPIIPKDGTRPIIFFNPAHPEETYESPFKTGDMGPEALEKLRQTGRVDLANIRGGYAEEVARIRGDEARKTGAAKVGANETPQQRRIRYLNRAIQAVNEHPEWKDYIRFTRDSATGNNDFEINPPRDDTFWRKGESKDLHDQIYQYIYGSENAGQQPVQPNQSPLRDPGGVRKP